jgi:hypothetical protein
LIFIFALFIFIAELSPSSDGSLNNSSECLTTHDDDSDLTKSMSSPDNDEVDDSLLIINKSSPLQLTEKPIMSLRDYLHALDRHKSIDNCFLSPFGGDRLYLFDEIKKITNHLFKITVQAEPHSNGDAIMHENQASDIINQHRVHDMNIQNLNTTQTTTVDLATKSNTFEERVNCVDVKNNKTCDGNGVDENNNKINDAEGTSNDEKDSARSHPFSEIFKKFSSLADAGNDLSNVRTIWPVSTKRTKFRINQMSSRDVPIFKTERPAKLQKQNAIDDTKMFDEKIDHKSMFNNGNQTPAKTSIVDILESFERDRNEMLESHFRHKTFIDRMPNSSISFDCGQLGVEHRSMNSTIRSLFQLHATTGRNVKQIQEQIESKNK